MSALLSALVGIIEPTFSNGHHAQVDAALIQALMHSGLFGQMRFFAAPIQQQAVTALLPDRCRRALDTVPIRVGPPGGVRLSRALRQLANFWAASRQTETLLVLSSGPETFFVCRLICLLRPRLRIAVVLHGNLESAVGWRSRDPRRRWFDYRAGLRAAVHPRIRPVVLEPAIRQAVERHGIPGWERTGVIPFPVAEREFGVKVGFREAASLTLGFIGHAKRSKGFSGFLGLANRAKLQGQPYRFTLAGSLVEAFPVEDLAVVECPDKELSRAAFLQAIYGIDYACLLFDPSIYEFTASGSLLDAVCALKPVIAIAFPALLDLVGEFGPLGFVCADLEDVQTLLGEPARLMDRVAYAGFQANMQRLRESRVPSALARHMAAILQPALAAPGRHG